MLIFLKHKNIFATGYFPSWSVKVFGNKKLKHTVPWKYVTFDLNGEEIVGKFYVKELQNANEKEFKVEKVTKRKGHKFFAKYKRLQ